MDVLDLVLVALIVLAGVNGYRRGAVLQLTTYLGLLIGLLLGAVAAPALAGLVSGPAAQSAIALFALLGFAALGDAAGWLVGTKAWAAARASAFRLVDAAAGTIVAIMAVLLATWFVGLNLANGPFPSLGREIRGSAIVQTLDDTLPPPPSILAQVRQFLNRFGFPEVFAGLPPAPAGPVRGPTKGQTARAARFAEASTVRIVGQACGAIQEGSGFVAAPNYVITNAHVVAGVRAPSVQKQNGGSQPGRVVLFDPKLDLAVIWVEGAPGPTLRMDPQEEDRGTAGAVLGYPGGGPLTVQSGAVRRELQASGRDIYGRSLVVRHVYELQSVVRPGNSGGPFVLTNGEVSGVVFAASTTDPQVAYALTSSEVIPLLQRAEGLTAAVSTQGCAR